MKNHRFPWLRNRTTDNRKCEKACNIKEKRTIEMFNTVSKLHVVHHSSANVNKEIINFTIQNVSGRFRTVYYTPGHLSWGVFL